MPGTTPVETRDRVGPEADVAVLRQLTWLVIAGLLATLAILAFLIFASFQAVTTIDSATASREREQVLRAIAVHSEPINAVSASAIAETLGLDSARLGPSQTVRPGEMQVPIGPSLVLAWRPSLVGSQTFVQIAPLRIAAAIGFAVIVMLIGWRLYSIGRRLDRRRADAARLAATDALTGLANRFAFDAALVRFYRERSLRGPFALIAIDLDGFKAVNDTYGHAAGDRLLQAVAAHLKAATAPADCVARVGGDEFFVLRTAIGVDAFVQDIRARIESSEQGIAASVGVALSSDFPFSITALTHAADAALYRAKRAGGRSAEFAVPASLQAA